MRRVLILVLLVALGLSAELWVNAIRDPGAELGQGDWETDFYEWPEGGADSARVNVHDTTRAFEGEYSFLTDTEKDPKIESAHCDVWCYQELSIRKAVKDIDSCYWMLFMEENDIQNTWGTYIRFYSKSGKRILWYIGRGVTGVNDTVCSTQFPLPDSGEWTEYKDDLNSKWTGAAGWSSFDTIIEVQIYSVGFEDLYWMGQEVSWDNIVLQSIAYYDYAAVSIDSDVEANEHYIPIATFANEGILDDKDGIVYAEILDGETRVYIDSQSVSIPAESSEQVTFSEWTVPHDGSYTLRVYPILELDEFSDDDTLEMALTGEGVEEIPVETELIRTSYNPTGVLFSFPFGTNGKLAIYDASGREIHSYDINSGTREHLWSTLEIPTGLYFYRFNSERLSVTDKLVVLY